MQKTEDFERGIHCVWEWMELIDCEDRINCWYLCAYYKSYIDLLLDMPIKSFIEFYISYKTSGEKDQSVEFKIEEYIKCNYKNKWDYFSSLIVFLKEEFLKVWNGGNIPDSIISLILLDEAFWNYIAEYIKNTNTNIINIESINYFEELSFLLYLSWINADYDISSDTIFNTSYTNLGLNSILGLLKHYYSLLEKSIDSNDDKTFDVLSNFLINLLEIINNTILILQPIIWNNINIFSLIANINTIVKDFFNLIEKNPNTIKWKDIINLLNINMGKIDIIFTHIIVNEKLSEEKDLSLDSILNFYNIWFSYQIRWYDSIKQNTSILHKWEYIEQEADININKAFLWNTSILLLELLDNLSINNIDINFLQYNPKFISIISLYNKFINIDFKFSTIEKFKNELLSNLFFVYNNKSITSDVTLSLNDFIEDFISKENITHYEIESIYNIVKYSTLKVDLALKLGIHLLNSNFTNYYYEDFKIKILSSILKYFPENDYPIIDNFLDKLIFYISENKIASNLLFSYSELYLSLASYYAKKGSYDNIEKAKILFSKFRQIRPLQTLNSKSILSLLDSISEDIGLETIRLSWNNPSETNIDILKMGKFYLREALPSYYSNIKNDINTKITQIINSNMSLENYDMDLKDEIWKILSSNLFHWFCDIDIITNKDFKRARCRKWYKIFTTDLYDWYKLEITYPTVYESIFFDIYSSEWEFVKDNIKNIIMTNSHKKALEYDKVTWLLNEARFISDIEENPNTITSLMIIRLTNVWDVNKWYSLELWNKYLSAFSSRLKITFSEIASLFYRWSASNFLLILKKWTTEEDVKRLFWKIDKEKIVLDGLAFPVNCKFWAVLNNEWTNLYEKAIIALDNAKQGNKKESFYDDSMIDTSYYQKNMNILHLVKEAIDEDRVVPYFQSIVNLSDLTIIDKYEVLVRIKTTEWKLIPPFEFLPVLERTWKLWEITKIIIEKSFSFVIRRDKNISINITSEDLNNALFLDFIDAKIGEYGVDTSKITFEVLENIFSSDMKPVLKELKIRWFKLAIDDFWEEGSNFWRLFDFIEEWIIDYLKIDGWMIKRLLNDPKKITFYAVEGTLKSANAAWIKVIAEYVENEQLLEKLQLLWVDFWQWYHFAKPLPEDEI